MIAMYCALLFQNINFWDSQPINLSMKKTHAHALEAVKDFNFVSLEYGFEVKTWGAALKKCIPVPPKDQLRELGYFVEFDGDGKVCR